MYHYKIFACGTVIARFNGATADRIEWRTKWRGWVKLVRINRASAVYSNQWISRTRDIHIGMSRYSPSALLKHSTSFNAISSSATQTPRAWYIRRIVRCRRHCYSIRQWSQAKLKFAMRRLCRASATYRRECHARVTFTGSTKPRYSVRQ